MTRTPIDAAVLVPLVRTGDGLSLVFIVRTDFGPHAGEVAFPGGRHEEGDASRVDTALREFEEELGVSRDVVTVERTLARTHTLTTGYRVTPVLGRLDALPEWRPDPREVARVLHVPLDALRDPANRGRTDWSGHAYPCIRTAGHVIWGLTYRILEQVLPLLPATETDAEPSPDGPEHAG